MERIEILNQRLIDYFGLDTESDRPIWKLVWSDDQYEMRSTYYTVEGLELLHPKVLNLPKYPYIKSRYVLERLVLVPETQQHELPTSKVSYEPMWTFEDNKGNSLPPKWEPIKLIIDTIYAAIGKHNSTVKYKDPDAGLTTKDLIEKEAEKIKRIQEDLFGNETDVTDALANREGVSVPSNYKVN